MNRSRSDSIQLKNRTRMGGDAATPPHAGAGLRPGAAALVGIGLLAASSAALADGITLPPISIGAGLITSYDHSEPDGGLKKDDFNIDNVRLYISGSATDTIKYTFNSDYNDGTGQVQVIDAIARFEYSDQVNIWVGRMLAPSDRSNLYGGYYSNLQHGNYSDGIQDGYSSKAVGRTNGVMYWGQFGPVKLSAGAFDDPTPVPGKNDLIFAERALVDFWDPEAGYYLNGTYYGDKNILAIGIAAQERGSNKDYSADLLVEKKFDGVGVFGFEGEYAKYDHLAGPFYDGNDSENDGGYGLVSYLFPMAVGPGKPQLLVKYAKSNGNQDTGATSGSWKTTDVELNYIVKEFNLRAGLFFHKVSYDGDLVGSDGNPLTGIKVFGVSLQVQM